MMSTRARRAPRRSPDFPVSIPDDLGRPLEVIWEKELDAEILSTESWGLLAGRGFDPPDRFSAYYHTLRWNRVTASRTDLLQAPLRAGISIEHYQLEPLRMALGMPRVNLFVADGVGLGKTIEAGLIARELLLRRKVSDIVVCCPASMLLQWREEMESGSASSFRSSTELTFTAFVRNEDTTSIRGEPTAGSLSRTT